MRLLDFQRPGVAFLARNKRAILADPPGLGKTAQLIRTLQVLAELGQNPFPALIVCPNSLKSSTWSVEFTKWAPEIEVVIIDGGAAKRRKQLAHMQQLANDGHQVAGVINWEAVRLHSRLAAYGTMSLTEKESAPKELNEMGLRTVICDEAHRLKDPKSSQSRATWAVLHGAEFRYLATGTPIADNIADLWALLHGIEPEWLPARTKYVDRYAETSVNFFGGLDIHGIRPTTRDEFFKIVDPLMRRIPKKAALPQLPAKLPTAIRHTPMLPKQKKAYDQMREHMIANLGELLVAPNPLAQLMRLNQLASSCAELTPVTRREWRTRPVLSETDFISIDGVSRPAPVRDEDGEIVTERYQVEYPDFDVRLIAPSPKVDDLIDLLEELGDEPLVVGAVSRQLIELAAERLERLNIPHGLVTGAQSGYERGQAVERFQNGKHRVILLTLGAGAEGLTLTRASRMLFMQDSYSAIQNQQAEDRIYRIGSEQHDSVQIIKQIAPGTIEETKQDILLAKALRAEEVVRDQSTLLRLLGETP
jgi:SNF2 family DNA or RNA helicase